MQSATVRALEQMNDNEETQQKLEEVYERQAKAESKKLESLKHKISVISQQTSKVNDKLLLKNQMREDEHLRIWEKNIQKRKVALEKTKHLHEARMCADEDRREINEERALKKA